MLRRTFLATLPLAAAGSSGLMKGAPLESRDAAQAEGASSRAAEVSGSGRRQVRSAGCACGRPPGGRKFCVAVSGAGMLGRGGHGASAGHPGGNRDAQEGWVGGRCGRGSERRARLGRAHQLGPRRRLLCAALGPEGRRGDGPGRVGPFAQVADPGDGAGAVEEWSDPAARRDCSLDARELSTLGGRCTSATES